MLIEGGIMDERNHRDSEAAREEATLLLKLREAAERELADLITSFERNLDVPTEEFFHFVELAAKRIGSNHDEHGDVIKGGFNDLFSEYIEKYYRRKEDSTFRHDLFSYFVHVVNVLNLLRIDLKEGVDSKENRQQALELIRQDHEKAKSFLAQKIESRNGKGT